MKGVPFKANFKSAGKKEVSVRFTPKNEGGKEGQYLMVFNYDPKITGVSKLKDKIWQKKYSTKNYSEVESILLKELT